MSEKSYNKKISKKAVKSEIQEMKERGYEYIGTADNFKMPKWMDCTWRRIACGKSRCFICGQVERGRLKHIKQGKNPDDMMILLEDIGKDFKKVLTTIKKDAEARGIDLSNIEAIEEPPELEAFPVCLEILDWRQAIINLAESADLNDEEWLISEAAEDLFWYKNILLAKTYRQYCTKWETDQGNTDIKFDYKYTSQVIKECVDILKRSLIRLITIAPRQKTNWAILLARLNDIEAKILRI